MEVLGCEVISYRTMCANIQANYSGATQNNFSLRGYKGLHSQAPNNCFLLKCRPLSLFPAMFNIETNNFSAVLTFIIQDVHQL